MSTAFIRRELQHHLGWISGAVRWGAAEVPLRLPIWDFTGAAPESSASDVESSGSNGSPAPSTSLAPWVVTSDSEEGGLSSCTFALVDEARRASSDGTPSRYASFRGQLRVDVARAHKVAEDDARQRLDAGEEPPPATPLPGEVTRAFCSIRTSFPREFTDLSAFSNIELWLRLDHNPVVVNVRAHSLIPDDLYQGYLAASAEQRGEWLRFELPFERFVLTSFGFEKSLERDMVTARMQTVRAVVAGRVENACNVVRALTPLPRHPPPPPIALRSSGSR
jgi:hypothetical protein